MNPAVLDLDTLRAFHAVGKPIDGKYCRRMMHRRGVTHDGVLTAMLHIGALERTGFNEYRWRDGASARDIAETAQTWLVCMDDASEAVLRMTVGSTPMDVLLGMCYGRKRLETLLREEETDVPTPSPMPIPTAIRQKRVREEILELVRANPGATVAELNYKRGTRYSSTYSTLRRMEVDNLVRMEAEFLHRYKRVRVWAV